MLAQAVEQAGSFDAKALTAALDKIKGVEGWTGSITLVPGSGNREPATVTVDVVKDGSVHRRSRLGEGGRRALLAEDR